MTQSRLLPPFTIRNPTGHSRSYWLGAHPVVLASEVLEVPTLARPEILWAIHRGTHVDGSIEVLSVDAAWLLAPFDGPYQCIPQPVFAPSNWYVSEWVAVV